MGVGTQGMSHLQIRTPPPPPCKLKQWSCLSLVLASVSYSILEQKGRGEGGRDGVPGSARPLTPGPAVRIALWASLSGGTSGPAGPGG